MKKRTNALAYLVRPSVTKESNFITSKSGHKCPNCDATLSSSSSLKRHLKLTHKEPDRQTRRSADSRSGKSFLDSSAKLAHQCPSCDSSFGTERLLDCHKSRRHSSTGSRQPPPPLRQNQSLKHLKYFRHLGPIL
jgi:hypothetical protein